MSSAAVIWHGLCFTWSGILTALGVLAAALALGAFRLAQGRRLRPLLLYVPAAVLFSLVLGRLCHWYCHPLQYAGFAAAMTDYSSGGFALPGAFAGALLAGALLRLGGVLDGSLPEFLDALAPAGALGIAVGRLGALFGVSDRGSFLPASPFWQRFPFSAPVSGAGPAAEWRFATFFWQAGAAFGLLLLLSVLFFRLRRRPERRGDVFWLGLALYAAVEVVLDGTRYDAGYLRANGFISLTQVGCVACLLLPALLYTVRLCRARAWRPRYLLLWAGFLAAGYLGGYMEYYVQRHGNEYALAFSVMSVCFLLLFAVVWLLCRAARRALPPVSARAGEAPVSTEVSS